MRKSVRRRSDNQWPAWRYGPDGLGDVFQCEADVPYGWTKAPGEVFVPAKTPMLLDRDQLTAELLEKGIVAKGNWSARHMKELLS